MRRAKWWTVAPGLAALAGAIVLLLWPLNTEGASGNAIRPHYRDFGWFSYAPLPANPSRADLGRAGVVFPDDEVAERRRGAAVLAGLGVVGLAAGVSLRQKTH